MENITEITGLRHKLPMNDGNEIPGFGLGMFLGNGFHTYQSDHRFDNDPQELAENEDVCSFALKHGYQLFDTAACYGTETSIGSLIKQPEVKRENIFIVSKISRHGYKECMVESLASIKNPFRGKLLETYDALLELKKKGLIRSVGVSNFNIDILEGLRKAERPLPAVNQIELHPFMRQKEIVSYCRKNGIQIMAYSPLTKGKKLHDPQVISMANRYNKTVAQLFIRWCVQCGFITIPKSCKKERIIENTQVFDWRITNEDMEILNSLPEETCMDHIPTFSTIPYIKWEDYK